ncbi:MAG: hypothetical protein IJV48_04895 [Ruminococcus sp.]|nr:hypothetical protein [Ruminococcus sp.]
MKKTVKLLALMTVIAVVALSLCSCRSMDETIANQAFYTDSTKTEFTLRGKLYRKMDIGRLSFIDAGNYPSQNNGCYITEKDVPALLSSWYGDWYFINDDETVVYVYGDNYVREDKYEAVKEVADSAVLDHYYISYYPNLYHSAPYESIEADYWDTDTVSNILLDQDVTDAINNALKTAESDKVQLSDERLQSVDAMMIERCDKDMIVTTYDSDVVLLRDGEKCYVSNDGSYYRDDEYTVCPFDKEGEALIKALFEKYPEATDQTAF